MKTALTAAALALVLALAPTALPSPAGEEAKPPEKTAVEKMDPKAKSLRIRKLESEMGFIEERLRAYPSDIVKARREGKEDKAKLLEERIVELKEKTLPPLRIQLRWLKGELTLPKAEDAVKAAEEVLAKAKETKRPIEALEKTLAAATFERDEIKRLEEAEAPKAPEPN
jgi:hypothetical protein